MPSHLPPGARFPENPSSPGIALRLTVSPAASAGRKTWQLTDVNPALHLALTLRVAFFFQRVLIFSIIKVIDAYNRKLGSIKKLGRRK